MKTQNLVLDSYVKHYSLLLLLTFHDFLCCTYVFFFHLLKMKFPGVSELKYSGAFYLIGVVFFKSERFIPFAHAIWHIFVNLGVITHYLTVFNCFYVGLPCDINISSEEMWISMLPLIFGSFCNKRSHIVGNHFFQEEQISDLEHFCQFFFLWKWHV